MEQPLAHAMTQQALVRTAFRTSGPDAEVTVPEGPLEIEFGAGRATLRWTDAQGRAGRAQIGRDDYERYVAAGWIQPSLN